jgi:hypothetical protein
MHPGRAERHTSSVVLGRDQGDKVLEVKAESPGGMQSIERLYDVGRLPQRHRSLGASRRRPFARAASRRRTPPPLLAQKTALPRG